jgi:hypothetical protein
MTDQVAVVYIIRFHDPASGSWEHVEAYDFNEAAVSAEQLALKTGEPTRVFMLHSSYELETKAVRKDHMRGVGG